MAINVCDECNAKGDTYGGLCIDCDSKQEGPEITMARIVETDNFARDYPNEKFILWPLGSEVAQSIADALNRQGGAHAERYYKVVPNDYQLLPDFEP